MGLQLGRGSARPRQGYAQAEYMRSAGVEIFIKRADAQHIPSGIESIYSANTFSATPAELRPGVR